MSWLLWMGLALADPGATAQPAQPPPPVAVLPDVEVWGVPVWSRDRARIWTLVGPDGTPVTHRAGLPPTAADGTPLPTPRRPGTGQTLPAATPDGTPLPNPFDTPDVSVVEAAARGTVVTRGGVRAEPEGYRYVRRKPGSGWRVLIVTGAGAAAFAGTLSVVSAARDGVYY